RLDGRLRNHFGRASGPSGAGPQARGARPHRPAPSRPAGRRVLALAERGGLLLRRDGPSSAGGAGLSPAPPAEASGHRVARRRLPPAGRPDRVFADRVAESPSVRASVWWSA